jgi:hypothetical protein
MLRKQFRTPVLVGTLSVVLMLLGAGTAFAEASAPEHAPPDIGCYSVVNLPGVEGITLVMDVTAPPAELDADDCFAEDSEDALLRDEPPGLPLQEGECPALYLPAELWESLLLASDALPGIYGLDPVRCGDLVMVDLAAPDGVPTGDCPGALELPVERWLGLVPISDAVPQDIGDGCPAVPIAVDAPVVKL